MVTKRVRMSTREALLSATTELLDGGGVEAVTLREVGRRAGVSHNAPYKHFASKEDLLAEVAIGELKWLTALIDDTRLTTDSPVEVVREVMRAYATRALHHPARFALVYIERHSEPAEFKHAAGAAWRNLVEAVAAAQDAGELPRGHSERLTALIRALTHGAIDLALSGHLAPGQKGNAEPEDLLDDLFAFLTSAADGDTSK
jgi:AcrR family transcriptional regulator